MIGIAEAQSKKRAKDGFNPKNGKCQRLKRHTTKELKKSSNKKLKKAFTFELCQELGNRIAVNEIQVDYGATKEINIKVEGACRVFIVYD